MLDPDRVGAHQTQRFLVLCDCADRASHECSRQVQRQSQGQRSSDHESDQQSERNSDVADPPGLTDIGRSHRALIHPELQDDQHLDDERDAEEERDAANAGVTAALFECFVVQAIGHETEHEEHRCDQPPRQQRIDPVLVVEEEHRVGRQHQEGRMRDMRDVKQAERDGQSETDRCVEAAEQHTNHHCVQQQVH